MRKRFSKRLLSIFTALLMVFSSVMYLPNELFQIKVEAVGGEITESQVVEKLNTLVKQYNGTAQNWNYNGGEQCYAFAHIIFNSIFGLDHASIGSYNKGTEYKFNSVNSNVFCVGTLAPGYTDSQLENLLDSVKPGDYIQLKRRAGGPHSEIVRSIDPSNNNITVFDANSGNVRNQVRVYTQHYFNNTSIKSFKNWNQAVSVYRFKNYITNSTQTTPPKINNYYISQISKDSFRVVCDCDNINSIKNVKMATWTTSNQSDLIWRDACFNGYSSYFIDIPRSEYRDTPEVYITHIYIYDKSGKFQTQEIQFWPDYNKPKFDDYGVNILYNDSFRIVAKISDENGISSVKIGTWTTANQSDIKWRDADYNGYGTYFSDIPYSDFRDKPKVFISHIYAYDSQGNLSTQEVKYYPDYSGPIFDEYGVNKIFDDSFRIVAKISDNSGISSVKIGTWTTADQSDIKWRDADYNGYGTYFSDIPYSDFRDSPEIYISHIYAYDTNGNLSTREITYTPICNHSYSDWKTEVKPMCDKDGLEVRKCLKCGNYEIKTITAQGHNYVDIVVAPTCNNNGYIEHKCSVCGDTYKDTETKAKGHSWSDWKITKPATEDVEGVETRECSACHEKETRAISKLKKKSSSSSSKKENNSSKAENSSSSKIEKNSSIAEKSSSSLVKNSSSKAEKLSSTVLENSSSKHDAISSSETASVSFSRAENTSRKPADNSSKTENSSSKAESVSSKSEPVSSKPDDKPVPPDDVTTNDETSENASTDNCTITDSIKKKIVTVAPKKDKDGTITAAKIDASTFENIQDEDAAASTKLVVDDGITSIDLNAIVDKFTGLNEITIPDSVEDIIWTEPDSNKSKPALVCNSKSNAAIFANTAGFDVKYSDIMLGDVNGDGNINVTDIAMVAAHIKGIKALDENAVKAADVNSDNQVNVTDIAMIAAHIKGIKAIG